MAEPAESREGYLVSSRVATDEAVAAGPAIFHTRSPLRRMSNPINLRGEGQEEPPQPASGGRSDSDSDVDSDHADPGCLDMNNDPDPAAGATGRS